MLFIAVAWSGFLTYRSVAGSGEENGGVDHGEAKAPLIREDIVIEHDRRKGLPNLYAKEQDAEDTEEIVSVTMYPEKNCKGEPLGIFEDRDPGDEVDVCSSTTYRRSIRSFRIKGKNAFIEIFSDCGGTNYAASAFEADGCINVYSHPNFRHFKVRRNYFLQKKQIPERFLEAQRILVGVPSKSYRIIYSAESSEYFGYQMWANLYGYINSGQKGGTWTRLLTSHQPDDLATHTTKDGHHFPTFTAPRHPYAFRYGPLNKPDVIEKWYASRDAPKEEVIVVIDPDSWIYNDLSPWVNRVERGKAIGQAAYYHGSRRAQKLWKKLCKKIATAKSTLSAFRTCFIPMI